MLILMLILKSCELHDKKNWKIRKDGRTQINHIHWSTYCYLLIYSVLPAVVWSGWHLLANVEFKIFINLIFFYLTLHNSRFHFIILYHLVLSYIIFYYLISSFIILYHLIFILSNIILYYLIPSSIILPYLLSSYFILYYLTLSFIILYYNPYES